MAPPDLSAKPPRRQLENHAKGRGAGRWLLPAAGSGGRGARADPRFGCLLWGPGSLGGGGGVTAARAAQRAAKGVVGSPPARGGLPPPGTHSREWRRPGWGTRAARSPPRGRAAANARRAGGWGVRGAEQARGAATWFLRRIFSEGGESGSRWRRLGAARRREEVRGVAPPSLPRSWRSRRRGAARRSAAQSLRYPSRCRHPQPLRHLQGAPDTADRGLILGSPVTLASPAPSSGPGSKSMLKKLNE